MGRKILHCDLNCFYASVEMYLNPELRGKAVAVCGNVEDRHGIVLTKSEKAKKCGVQTGETVWQARQKYPELIVVPPHFEQYMKFSCMVRKIYEDYTDQIEAFGIDECWLDVTGSIRLFGSAEDIANEIRNRVKNEIGLTISVGVSFNKIFAKLGSDMKKPDAVTVIPEESFREIIWGLPASDILGVGRATKKHLAQYGIKTVGDLAKTPTDFLRKKLGVNGLLLWRYANGLDNSEVANMNYHPEIKSVGHGITCTKDLYTENDVWRVFYELSREISDKLHDKQLMATGMQIAVKNKDLETKQFQGIIAVPTQSLREIAMQAQRLFTENYDFDVPVRSLTVRAINLVSAETPIQLTLDYDAVSAERQGRIEGCMRKIRNRYGNESIKFATLVSNIAIPDGRNHATMPTGLQR